MWRLSAIGARPAIRRQVAVSASKSRETHASNESRFFYDPSSGRHIEADLLDLESLEQNTQLKGPALIVSSDTAIVLPTGSEATVAAEGHLVIDVKSA